MEYITDCPICDGEVIVEYEIVSPAVRPNRFHPGESAEIEFSSLTCTLDFKTHDITEDNAPPRWMDDLHARLVEKHSFY